MLPTGGRCPKEDALGRGLAASPGANDPIPEQAGAGGIAADKEPFEGFGDGSQGLAVPLTLMGEGWGELASIGGFILPYPFFFFCLCPVWSSLAESKSRRLRYL